MATSRATLQGERFDPEGAYVSRWLPELAWLRALDAPTVGGASQVFRDAGLGLGVTCPSPIVDRLQQRDRAVAKYRNVAI